MTTSIRLRLRERLRGPVEETVQRGADAGSQAQTASVGSERYPWLGSPNPEIIACGHSHRGALNKAQLFGLIDFPVAILDDGPVIADEGYWAEATTAYPGIPLAISWQGNEHNGMFMLDLGEPFRLWRPGVTAHQGDGSWVPANMLREAWKDAQVGLAEVIQQRRRVSDVIVIATPPPKSDYLVRQGLLNEPVFLNILAKRGVDPDQARVTPFATRHAMWALMMDIYADIAQRSGATFVGIPAGATDATGALREELDEGDATHANEHFGVLMWNAVRAAIHDA